MKKTFLITTLIAGLSLSGCAQLANFGDMMWTESRHFASQSSQKIAGLLRPRAPRAEPVFVKTNIPAPQFAQNSDMTMYNAPIATPKFAGHEVETAQVSAQTEQYISDMRPTPTYESAMPASTPYAEPEMPDLSYVKLAGGANISDWQACQAQAGSYIQPQGAGFTVHPTFDYCMRVKGYISERDALEFMDSTALP